VSGTDSAVGLVDKAASYVSASVRSPFCLTSQFPRRRHQLSQKDETSIIGGHTWRRPLLPPLST
jgi:hypothetical protein